MQIEPLDVDSVQQAVRTLAAMPAGELSALAMRAWSFARDHHTHERLTEKFCKAFELALATVQPATVP